MCYKRKDLSAISKSIPLPKYNSRKGNEMWERKLVSIQRKNAPTRREPLKRLVQTGSIIRTLNVDYSALTMIAEANIGFFPGEIAKQIAPNDAPLSILGDGE